MIFRNSIYVERQNEFNFYKQLDIPKTATIYDVGANIGDKTHMFSKLAHKTISIEPDQTNYQLLTKRFKYKKRIKIINLAVGDKSENSTFYVTDAGSPANTLSTKWKNILEDPQKNRWSKSLNFAESYSIQVETLDNLFKVYGIPYFIKIDVEGFELQVIKGLKKPIPILSIEANFPEFREETITSIHILKSLSSNVEFNIIDPKHKILWPKNKSASEMIEWLMNTPLKYFEIFAFSKTNQ